MELVPYTAQLMRTFLKKEVGVPQYIREVYTESMMQRIETEKRAYIAVVDDDPIMCGGISNYWANRGEAWTLLDQNCKKNFLVLHKKVKSFLDNFPCRRIEAAVDVNFEPGHRWARLLGFKLEAPLLRAYTPDGRDHALYALVKD